MFVRRRWSRSWERGSSGGVAGQTVGTEPLSLLADATFLHMHAIAVEPSFALVTANVESAGRNHDRVNKEKQITIYSEMFNKNINSVYSAFNVIFISV